MANVAEDFGAGRSWSARRAMWWRSANSAALKEAEQQSTNGSRTGAGDRS